MKTRTVKRSSADIAVAMRKRYPSNAFALLFEVGDATGFECSRHADAIAMSLWPSRGLHFMGFEFKASRSDWVKERDDPAKSEAILRFCDYWYLVVADEKIVQSGELPESWGMLAVGGQGTLGEIKKAPKLDAIPWTREFTAAIMRCVSDPVAAIDNTALMRAREEGRREQVEQSERVRKQISDQHTDLVRRVAEFEQIAGVSISHRWGGMTANELASALRSLADREACDRHVENLGHLQRSADKLSQDIRRESEAIKTLLEAPCA